MPQLVFFVPFLSPETSPCLEIWTGSYSWISFASSVIASDAPDSDSCDSSDPCDDLLTSIEFYSFSVISLGFCFFFENFCSVSLLGSYSVTSSSSSFPSPQILRARGPCCSTKIHIFVTDQKSDESDEKPVVLQ